LLFAMLGLTAATCNDSKPDMTVATFGYAPGLQLDLYTPASIDLRQPRTATPAVVLVHGGGFTGGTRQEIGDLAREVASRGVIAASIDYRLTRGGFFPVSAFDDRALLAAVANARDDAMAAVAWLVANAEQHGVDASHIAVAGWSAGGITAIEVATHDPTVVGAVSVSGAGADLTAIDAGDPPLELLHGTADPVVPIGLADATCAAASAAGVTCRVQRYEGKGHELPGESIEDTATAIVRMVTA